MRPVVLLSLLLGAAIGLGGILQGLHWKNTSSPIKDANMQNQISDLQGQIEILERENKQLRSLSQGGGEVDVPEALIEFVETSTGLEFRSTPVIHQIAGEELRERVSASIESKFPPNELYDRETAWKMMGLLETDDSFTSQLSATYSIGARSWFDDQVGEGWVTDRFEENSVPDQGALIRALSRILLHQHYPPPVGYPGDEADRARTAIHHGAALSVESKYLARQALSNGITGSAPPTQGAKELLETLSIYVRGLSNFPSRFGLPMADILSNQGKLTDTLHTPPTSTFYFLDSAPNDEITDVELPEQAGEGVITESAGWLGLKLWIETIDPSMEELGASWRGDTYQLTATSDTTFNLVWDIICDSEESADTLSTLGCQMIAKLANSETIPKVGETLTSPERQLLSIARPAPNRIRFSNLSPN